jgi:hypothetical protein
MTRRAGLAGAIVLMGLALGLFSGARDLHAIEVKKDLYGGGGGAAASGGGGPARANPLTPGLQKKLIETVEAESDSYVADESEKKASGQIYVDLENGKLKYFPQNTGGKVQVAAKLEGKEFKGPSEGTGKGKATGKRRALVFKYRLDGQTWTEVTKPAWEDVVDKGAKAAKAAD